MSGLRGRSLWVAAALVVLGLAVVALAASRATPAVRDARAAPGNVRAPRPSRPVVSPAPAAGADESPAETVQVSGAVKDGSGAPLAQATIWVRLVATREAPETRVDVDASGHFTTDVPRAQYVLRATSPGYAPVEAWIIATHDTKLDFTLTAGATLRGTVVAHDGSPVTGATVVVDRRPAGTPFGARTTTADASGAFTVGELAPGDYDVVAAQGPMFGRLARPASLHAGEVAKVIVEVSRAQAVSGHVRLRGGEPVAGARVSLRAPSGGDLGATAVSDADGAYRLDGAPAGSVVVHAEAKGHDPAEATADVEDGNDAHGVDVVLSDEKDLATLEGHVLFDDGTPAEGALVAAGERATTAAEGGAFTLSRVRPSQAGEVAVRATFDRAPDAEPLVTVLRRHVDPGEHVVELRLVFPRGMASIAGLVLDGHGQPLGGALVGAADEDDVHDPSALDVAIAADVAAGRAVRSLPDGTFKLAGLAESTFVVWATHEGLARVVVPDVEAGATDVRLQFSAATRLAGIVVGPDGTPTRTYRLLVRGQDEEGRPTDPEAHPIDDPTGAFDVRGLTAGTYSLLAQTTDGRAAKLDGVVLAGGDEKTGLRLVTAPGIALEGRILDGDTRHPIAGAHVVVVGQIGSDVTDDYGVYRIAGLAADGNVRLETDVDGDDYVYDVRSVDLSLRQGRVTLNDAWMMRTPRVEVDGETGLVCENWDGRVMVTQVLPGSPAQSAGVRLGDRLMGIETTPASPYGDAAIDLMLRGSAGTSVTLTVLRVTNYARRISVIRAAH